MTKPQEAHVDDIESREEGTEPAPLEPTFNYDFKNITMWRVCAVSKPLWMRLPHDVYVSSRRHPLRSING